MPRNYKNLVSGDGILVPRWLLILLVVLVFVWLGFRIMSEPTWMVQRLDSPDGTRAARLLKTEYIQYHFNVQVREGLVWRTAFVSEPYEKDYTIDLKERLRWSEDSRRLYLHIQEEPVWGYDFEANRRISRQELMGHE